MDEHDSEKSSTDDEDETRSDEEPSEDNGASTGSVEEAWDLTTEVEAAYAERGHALSDDDSMFSGDEWETTEVEAAYAERGHALSDDDSMFGGDEWELKEFVRSEVEAAFKEKEDRLCKNGKEAFEETFAALKHETRKNDDALTKKMDLLKENITSVSNEQKSLQSMLMDINNLVDNILTKKTVPTNTDSDSTKMIESRSSSDIYDGDKSEYTSPFAPLWEFHAPICQLMDPMLSSYATDISNPRKARSYQFSQQKRHAYQFPLVILPASPECRTPDNCASYRNYGGVLKARCDNSDSDDEKCSHEGLEVIRKLVSTSDNKYAPWKTFLTKRNKETSGKKCVSHRNQFGP